MKEAIESVRIVVRRALRLVAKLLHAISGGRITPNGITWFGLATHVPIALLIGQGYVVWGGILLIIFGLFDTLDGEMARLQQRVTNNGSFLDASTDRFKEVLLYSGVAYLLANGPNPEYAVAAVAACGASICVSYVKAKGEAIVAAARQQIPYTELNKMFSGGLFPFEIRMVILIAGLLANRVVWAVGIIAFFSAITAFQRLIVISRRLQ